MATSGPGATNFVTAIADTQMNSVSMVVITGQVIRALVSTDAFQKNQSQVDGGGADECGQLDRGGHLPQIRTAPAADAATNQVRAPGPRSRKRLRPRSGPSGPVTSVPHPVPVGSQGNTPGRSAGFRRRKQMSHNFTQTPSVFDPVPGMGQCIEVGGDHQLRAGSAHPYLGAEQPRTRCNPAGSHRWAPDLLWRS